MQGGEHLVDFGPQVPLEFSAFVEQRKEDNFILDLVVLLLHRQEVDSAFAEVVQGAVGKPWTFLETWGEGSVFDDVARVQVVEDVGQTVGVVGLGEDVLVGFGREDQVGCWSQQFPGVYALRVVAIIVQLYGLVESCHLEIFSLLEISVKLGGVDK